MCNKSLKQRWTVVRPSEGSLSLADADNLIEIK